VIRNTVNCRRRRGLILVTCPVTRLACDPRRLSMRIRQIIKGEVQTSLLVGGGGWDDRVRDAIDLAVWYHLTGRRLATEMRRRP